MDAFKGKYERTSAENYEEMLKVLDVNFLLRKAATASTPSNLLYHVKKLSREFSPQRVRLQRRAEFGQSRHPQP